MDEYRESVLKAIRDYEKQFHPVDQYEITDAIGELYEIIRAIPTNTKADLTQIGEKPMDEDTVIELNKDLGY